MYGCVGAINGIVLAVVSVYFDVSSLAQELHERRLQLRCWISSNFAYLSQNFIVTSCSTASMRYTEEFIHGDAFNSFQSSARMHEEQAFGLFNSEREAANSAEENGISRAGRDFCSAPPSVKGSEQTDKRLSLKSAARCFVGTVISIICGEASSPQHETLDLKVTGADALSFLSLLELIYPIIALVSEDIFSLR
eukprot:IDg14812t1